jgi:septum formation protein
MLYLASQSPRRAELLARLRLAFHVLDVSIPEHQGEAEPALDYVVRVAQEKAHAGWQHVAERQDAVVISADTEVMVGERVFGKPANALAATEMLHQLSGRTHRVVTAVAVQTVQGLQQACVGSEVTVRALSEADIASYVASGEWQGKAGAYAIQGYFERHVSHLSGSYSGIMGLPLHETAELLRRCGVLA